MRKEKLVYTLEQQLRAVKAERLDARREPALLAARSALKRFQSARLAATHADLLAGRDTHDAAVYFLEELYGAHDLSQRDVDLERIIPTLQRLLSFEALSAITDAIVLDALSERLDTAMARELGVDFDEDDYARAYRSVGEPHERARQLDLVQQLGESLCELVRIPLLSMTLTVMRGPARLARLGDLHEFLERGFTTFKKMREPNRFVTTICTRERQAMDNLFEGRADPFTL
ncbi:MAG: hypothetical protein V4857_11335 [Pseudomonadota bacterium]